MRRLLLALAFVAIARPLAAQALVNGKNPQLPADLGPNGGLKVECIAGTCTGSGGAAPDVNISAVGGNVVTTTLPVSGTFWQMTQPVSGTFWQVTQPVSGTFWQVTQPVSGTVTANAGTNLNTSALALSATQTDRTQKSQITDGTRDGTVKAASTAVAATDTSFVVALSPNSPALGRWFTAAIGQTNWSSATALNTTLQWSIDTYATTAFEIVVSGTVTSSGLSFESSIDGGSNWFIVNGRTKESNTGVYEIGWQTTPITGYSKVWSFDVAGRTDFRIRLSTVIAGAGLVILVPREAGTPSSDVVVTGGSKGVTVEAPVTTTAEGADHQALDVQLYQAGVAIDPRVLQAGTALIGKVGLDQTTPGTTNAISLAQIGATTTATGNGTVSAGVQRVAIASDNTAFTTNAVQSGTWTVQPGNTPNTSAWLMQPVTTAASTAGTLASQKLTLTTASNVKASAGNLYGWSVQNGSTTTNCYLQFMNSATGTLGTAPLFSVLLGDLAVATNAAGSFQMLPYPIAFSTGIAVGISTTYNGATACGTAGNATVFYQ